MKTIIGVLAGLVLLLGHSLPVRSAMYDVVTVKLQEGCTLEQLSKIVDDVAAYAKDNGGGTYELLAPLHSPHQGVYIVLERFPNATAFGTWTDHFGSQPDDSEAGRIRTRAYQCVTIVSHSSALTVQ